MSKSEIRKLELERDDIYRAYRAMGSINKDLKIENEELKKKINDLESTVVDMKTLLGDAEKHMVELKTRNEALRNFFGSGSRDAVIAHEYALKKAIDEMANRDRRMCEAALHDSQRKLRLCENDREKKAKKHNETLVQLY